MRKIVAWGNLGRHLADALAEEETIWITDRVYLSKEEKNRYKVVSVNISDVYAYRELRSLLRDCDSICLLGALHSKNVLAVLDMIAKVLQENRIERCDAFAVKPFAFEGEENAKRAKKAEMRLLEFCFRPMIYDNQKIVENTSMDADIGLKEALDHMFDLLGSKKCKGFL